MTATVTSVDTPARAPAAAAGDTSWPSSKQAYYTVFASALAVMFAEIDRNVMSLLVQPIKAAYQLSDFWMGMLLGTAFIIFYAACGVPLGRFIDRNNRKNILAAALAIWSLATVFCGLAQNFVQLFLARLFLGAGESVNGPAIFSMISDSFKKELLPRAIALMQFGVLGGNAFALIVGGLVIGAFSGVPDRHFLGLTIHWWQLVFVVVGLPGLLVALLIATTVKEPARRMAAGEQAGEKIGLVEVIGFMIRNKSLYGPMMGSMFIGALGMGVLTWHAAFYQRTYGWSPQQVGVITGTASLLLTPIGLIGGFLFAEWLTRKGFKDAPVRVVIIGRLIAIPAAIMMPLMPTPWLALAMSMFSIVMIGVTGSSQNAALQIVSPPRMRGQITALYMFLYSVIGNGVSIALIGFVTTYVLKDDSMLRYSILGFVVLFQPASLFVFWLGLKPFRREVERLEALETAAA